MRKREVSRSRIVLWLGLLVLTGCVQSPSLTFHYTPGTGHAPLSITFRAASSLAVEDEASYVWDFGDGASGTGEAVEHTFDVKGSYRVRLQVTSLDGKVDTAEHTVHVRSAAPHAEFSIDPFQAPIDYPIRFDASDSYDSDGEIVSFHWDFGDGTTALGEIVEHIFPEERVRYRVVLTITDADGDTSQASGSVEPIGCATCG